MILATSTACAPLCGPLCIIACMLRDSVVCRKQEGLGVSKKGMKPRKQGSVLNRALHEKRKKGKKKPRAWFHGE